MPWNLRMPRIACAAKLVLLLSFTAFAGAALTGCSSKGSSTPTPPAATAPAITQQPADATGYVGETVTLTVTATGTAPMTYDWQRNGTSLGAASSSSYTTPTLTSADNGASFTVKVSNSAGSATSNAAKLTVQIRPVTITTQPASLTVTVGASAAFSVAATGSAPITYQWTRGGTAIPGATQSNYTLPTTASTDDGAQFAVTVSNGAGSVTSSTATLSVKPAPVAITTQPASATRFVGETATFSVGVSGTNPTFQWRKNKSPISGATSATYTTPTLAKTDDGTTFDVVVENGSGSVNSNEATLTMAPVAYSYKDINGDTLSLYAWPGAKNAALSASSTLDGKGMRNFLNIADGIYGYYEKAVGQDPSLFVNYNGLATIAQVPSTCGAGCTYIGATGMEFLSSYFDSIEQEGAEGYTDQALAYEFGRSFWLMGNQLEFEAPDNSSCIVTGYAVLMRYEAIAGLGYKGYSNSTDGYNQALADTKGLVDLYEADSSLTWDNTTHVDNFTLKPGYGCSDLFASQMMRLGDTYGGQQQFINALWKQALLRPHKVVTQDAVDNLILAASAAANHNLTNQFVTTWRWPMSDAAKAEAQSKYGNP